MESEIQQIFVTNGRDWLGLIVECAVPVIIMIITLIVSRIQQNRALRQQAKESKQQLEQQAKEHAQEMLVQKDVLRLSIMPVFDVVSICPVNWMYPPSNFKPLNYRLWENL